MEIDAIKKVTRTSVPVLSEPVKPASSGKAAEVRAVLFQGPASTGNDAAAGEKVEKVAADVELLLKRLNTELRFDVNNEGRETIVRIVDVETGDVIRQIPSEELLALRERMDDLIGVLHNTKA